MSQRGRALSVEPRSSEASPDLEWPSPAVVVPILVLLGVLVSIWFAPYRIPPNDEGAVLTQAARILRGEIYYIDLDAYPFPLAPYLLAGAMAIAGEDIAVGRSLGSAVFIGIVLALYAIALPLLGRVRAALLGLLLLSFKFIAWPALTSFFYWDLAFCAACFAVALLIRHPFRGATRGLALAGVLSGIALLSKQSLGIYLALTASLLLLFPELLLGITRQRARDRWREVAVYVAGLVLALFPMLAYFSYHGALGGMIYSGLIRPFVSYLPTSGIDFWAPLHWWKLGSMVDLEALPYFVEPYWQLVRGGRLPGQELTEVYWLIGELFARLIYTSIVVAFTAVFALWLRALRRGDRDCDRELFVFAPLAGAIGLSALPRADFPHVISVYPLVLVLLFHLWSRLGIARAVPGSWRGVRVFEAAGVAAVLVVCVSLNVLQNRHLSYTLELDRAHLRIPPGMAWVESAVEYLREEIDPDEPLLVYGHEAYLYFLTDRYYPWPFVQLYPGQAGGDEGAALAELLVSDPPARIAKGMMSFPGLPRLPEYVPLLASEIRARYRDDLQLFRRFPPPAGEVPDPRQFKVMTRRYKVMNRPAGGARR